jgi:hypothetical protein
VTRDPDYDRLRERVEGSLEDLLQDMGDLDFSELDRALSEKFGAAWDRTPVRQQLFEERGLPLSDTARVFDAGGGTFRLVTRGGERFTDRVGYDDAVGRWRDGRGRFI